MVVPQGFRQILHHLAQPCSATSLTVPRALLVAQFGWHPTKADHHDQLQRNESIARPGIGNRDLARLRVR